LPVKIKKRKMDNIEEISNLKEELGILKEKLNISQSLIKIGFWEFNRENRQILLSDETLDILRLSKEKTIIPIEEFARIISEEQRPWLFDEINDIELKNKDIDLQILLKPSENEEERWIKIIANPSSYSTKNPNIIIGIVKDISEQKRDENLLKLAKERAEEADFLKSAFLANMSHEIRTPLNAILGFSQLLTNPSIPNKQRNEYSEYITSSANNLLNLVRDIIDVSKIEAGKMVIEKRDCEVNKILKELRFTFEKEKENQSKNHIQIILDEAIKDDEFSIITDPFRFHQIMVNLIGNGLKFIEKGFIEFGYQIINSEWLQFYVKDTGIGIPNDKIDLIFSRFGQIIDNKIKNPGGTGLGLSITKHLVERLGGRIWVESKPGNGTTFSFTLPFLHTTKSEYKSLKFDKELEELDLEDIKILAVEDDLINMVLLEDILNLYIKNVDLVKAYNGFEALDALNKADFDLIIMDVRMPKMDGYEATNRIRLEFEPPKSRTPILGLSAHALKEEIEKGKQIGMNDFLSKPIIPEDLLMKIKKLLTGLTIQTKTQEKSVTENQDNIQPKVLDISFLEKLFKNNSDKIKNTLKVYLEQIPVQLKLMTDACNSVQVDKLHNISHSLKSTFKYLGRIDLSEYSREIEHEIDPLEYKDLILEKINIINKEWNEIEKSINNLYFKEK
jgi:signal transduction histidine kinase/CheY-like chemotaxis protein/HPt (histidine-containing phosphotransfer) domain-containing protein